MESRQASVCMVPIAIFLALGLVACSSGKAGKLKAEGVRKDNALPVQVITVNSRKLHRTIEAVGSLYAYDEVVVSSEDEGKCTKVLVDVGDRVRKGQTLAQIEPVEFKLAVEQQEALLEEAKAQLGLDGNVDPSKLDPTQTAGVKKAAADLANAKQKFERTQALTEQGLIPKQTYDQDLANYKAAQATYDLALQSVRDLQAAYKEHLSMTALAKKKLHDTRIVAPFNGYVKERDVTIGQYLKVQTPVFTIVSVDPIRVRLKVPEKMAAWIPVGKEVSVSVDAYPNRTFSGKITRINPSVDPQTRSFEAEALIDNHRGLLKPGFFVKATVVSDKVDTAIFIPEKALSYAYGIYKVFEVQDNKLREKEVKLGDHMGNDVEVVQGLAPGARLALAAGNEELRNGSTIREVSLARRSSPPSKITPTALESVHSE